MNYLLDTHTFIWAITDKRQLSLLARQTIENTANEILVSTVSFWEVSLKHAIGKLTIHGFSPEELPRLAIESGFTLAPLLPEDAATYHQLSLVEGHKDPFDRMLIWQAVKKSLTLITKDKRMPRYYAAGLKVLW
jgi:PIN domain nuclease of toxin-antitoxin system